LRVKLDEVGEMNNSSLIDDSLLKEQRRRKSSVSEKVNDEMVEEKGRGSSHDEVMKASYES
jgi:hypothetical protein